MRNADRDQVTGFITTAPFRPSNRTSTSQLGSTVYTVLPREAQIQFQMGTGLSPVLTLEEHSRTTDVFGGAPMPVNFAAGPIS
jgi:hypothetical protein